MIDTIATVVQDFLLRLSGGSGDALALVGTLLGVAAMALVCFCGLRWFRFWCAAAGFGLFAAVGYSLCRWAGLGQYGLLAALVCGIIGALMAYRIVRCGVFVLCALCSYFVLQVLVGNLYICLAGAALVGLLGMFMTDVFIILTTGIFGALQLSPALVELAGLPGGWFWPIALLLALAGVAVQMRRRYHRH